MMAVLGSARSGDYEDLGLAGLTPDTVDRQISQAIMMCWMLLPPDKRTVPVVSSEIRRIVERALKNLEDDARVFGSATEASKPVPEEQKRKKGTA
jgi:hypothetical protein